MSKKDRKNRLQLVISHDELALLFASGLICVTEIGYLTTQSKQQIAD